MPTTAMGAVLIDPLDENTVYAGSGEANFANHSRPGEGVYKTTDGGATWTQLGVTALSGRCISRLAIDTGSPRRLYAALTRAGGFPGPVAAKGHPNANLARGLWVSSDGAVTWSRITGVPDADITDFVIEPGNANTLYAGVGTPGGSASNGVWKSVDRGATWARLSALPAATSIGRVGLGISPSNPARIYAYFARPADSSGGSATTFGAYRSEDRGLTWTLLSALPSMQATYGWYFTTICVNPTNSFEVHYAALELYRSPDAGVSFTSLGVPHSDVHSAVYDAAGRLVVGCDGGVFRVSGGNWSSLNNGLTLTQCYAGVSTHPTDDVIMTAGLQDNGSVLRATNSTVWYDVLGGDGGWTQIDQTNPQRMFGESQGTGALYRSSDGGATFTAVGSGLSGNNCFLPPYLIDPNNPARMLYGAERVWVSTNGGTTFSALSAAVTGGSATAAIRSMAIAPSNSRYVYVATNNGRVLASSDSGATFTLIRTGNPGWPRTTRELFVEPGDPMSIYLAGAGYATQHVLRSRNAGVTWETLDSGLPDIPVNTIAADTRLHPPAIYAGTEAGVYWTRDDGASWEVYGTGMPHVPVVDLRLEPARSRLVAATQGRGIWVTSIRACAADFNDDGGVDGGDIEAFFLAWQAGNSPADINGDGGVDGSDVQSFFTLWEQGC
jgi:photosystem II stability/assembly factor-like uncharacterized protein